MRSRRGARTDGAPRRAASGVIIIILENELKFNLELIFRNQFESRSKKSDAVISANDLTKFINERLKIQLREQGARHDLVDAVIAAGHMVYHGDKQDLREGSSASPELFLAYSNSSHLLIARRVEALGKFLDFYYGKNLLAGVRRASNILRIEESKDGFEYAGLPDPTLYLQVEETGLAGANNAAKVEAAHAVATDNFEAAMRAIAKLRPYVMPSSTR